MMIGARRWYVVQTHSHKELRAAQNLNRQGFATYLPRCSRKRRHARRTDVVLRPLFPRYLFVALDLAHDRWRSVQSTFGVNHLLTAGDEPLPIADELVDEIRAREDENGLVVLGLPPGIGVGSKVRLIDGIFAEEQGILERIAGSRRVSILLQLLGRDVRVLVPSASIGRV
jgi:transcriptional antiterminator RfaH